MLHPRARTDLATWRLRHLRHAFRRCAVAAGAARAWMRNRRGWTRDNTREAERLKPVVFTRAEVSGRRLFRARS
jgi:hypothetical protein